VKQPQKLPVVLTQVLLLLEAAPGPKYKAALGVAYGARLRVSMAVRGHKTLSMAQKYTAGAQMKRLATRRDR
jgi:hypothetical protein